MTVLETITNLRAVVVGEESLDNLKLANTLRDFMGKEKVIRYLELSHLLTYMSENSRYEIMIYLDLFSFDLQECTQTVQRIRDIYPSAAFCLYFSKRDHQTRWKELPVNWQARFQHYYSLHKEPDDVEFKPIVYNTIRNGYFYAQTNRLYLSKQETKVYKRDTTPTLKQDTHTIFLSYARVDWDNFVLDLADHLKEKELSVWVDQHLLLGGEDWMDAIGEALEKAKLLILIMSPEALASRYVRMEYRYFWNHDKPLIPLLYRPVEKLPPELMTTQYIDFTTENIVSSYDKLFNVTNFHLKR